MLCHSIADPDGVEGAPGVSRGLGLLEVETVLSPVKQLRVEHAIHLASGAAISGYHMHIGISTGPDVSRPFARIGAQDEGAVSADGRVQGTYLHGLFAADSFRRALLGHVASPNFAYEASIEQTLDDLAAHLERHLDIDALLGLAKEVKMTDRIPSSPVSASGQSTFSRQGREETLHLHLHHVSFSPGGGRCPVGADAGPADARLYRPSRSAARTLAWLPPPVSLPPLATP
ncbi:MAG: hypothetical protein MO852_01710 [Candidatus Devosia euplotis]|nr:hypothetical protein [Candidatus Devosia euplotis]